jgi:hypothetical protein
MTSAEARHEVREIARLSEGNLKEASDRAIIGR